MRGMDIYTLRKGLDLSQAEFAAALGISHKYVSHLETGVRKPSLKLAAKIERLSGVEGLVQSRVDEKTAAE